MNSENKQSRNRNSHLLSDQGLNKINEAIKSKFSGKQPPCKDIEEYILNDIERRKDEVPGSQVISNIINKKNFDISQIQILFQVLKLELLEQDTNNTNLSATGYKKLERAIKKNMSDKVENSDKYVLPGSEYIEERIKREIEKEKIDADTIKKILTREGKSDRRKIEYLFQAFRLKLTNEDLTSKSIEANNYNREQLCKKLNQNLPIPHNKFIGRKEKLQELMKYLSDDYPQTIIQVDGIGGVGKTALVLEAAYMCLEKREGFLSSDISDVPSFFSVIWTSAKEIELQPGGEITLKGQRTLQEIYRTIAMTLDDHSILYDTDGQHLERIINKLKNTPGKNLLVIDNLETIEDKKKVLGFIRSLHNTKIVITTRKLAFYTNISLDSLPDKESKELIRQQSDMRNLKLTDQQQQELCQASSGLPLAIIYTVGRLSNYRSLSEEAFKQFINEIANPEGDLAHFCFKESVSDIKNTASYQLLMALAIFDQSASKESIVEVAGLNSELEDNISKSLTELENMSLILYNNNRYTMLPITREYTIGQLKLKENSDFQKQARERWVAYYINNAKRLYEIQSKEERLKNFYSFLDHEWKNFLGVLRFCKDQHDYERVKELWSYLNNYANIKGYWQDRLDWLKWLIITSSDKRKYTDVVRFMVRKARVLLLMGKEQDLKGAEKTLLEAWELRQFAEFQDIDYLTNHFAGLYIRLEKYEQAHQWLDQEQENLNRETGLTVEQRIKHQIYIDRERAEVFFNQGNYQASESLCEKVIDKAKEIGDSRNEYYASKIIADIALDHRDLAKAEPLLKHGLRTVSSCNDRRRTAYYLVSLAKLEEKKGNLPEAKKHINQAISHFDKLGMVRDFKKAKKLQNELKEKS